MRSFLMFLLLTFSFSAFAAEPIELGVFKLKGKNPGGDRKYEGQIVIQKEAGNYRITWFIGSSQAQVGIGILADKVLSIGYADASMQDFGVVSLKVIHPKLLKGKWASIFSKGSFGEEEFVFEAADAPASLKPQPIKKKETAI